MRTQRTEEEVKMGWERTNSAGINQRALCRVRLKLDGRASAARTIARMHAYVQAEANGLFWRWFMPILRWKSRRRSFSPFARLSAEISSARINVYVRVRRQIFGITTGLDRPFIQSRGAIVNCAAFCFVVGTIKFRDRTNCARGQKKIFYAERDIM